MRSRARCCAGRATSPSSWATGVLAYFGWPTGARGRCRAGGPGRARHRPRRSAGLPARGGEHAGRALRHRDRLVVVGDLVGEGAAREEAVVGETPNLAARLQQLARPGTVVVGERDPASGRRPVRARASSAGARAQGLRRSRSGPTACSAKACAESRFEALHGPSLTPLVGREHELALLLERWDQAKDGEGQVVLLGGEPGIGKSRLLRALRERLADEPCLPLSHYCSPFHPSSALHPVIDLLERAAGFARDDTPAASSTSSRRCSRRARPTWPGPRRSSPRSCPSRPPTATRPWTSPRDGRRSARSRSWWTSSRAWPARSRCWRSTRTCTGPTRPRSSSWTW